MNLKQTPPTSRLKVLTRMSQGLRLVPDCCALCARFPCLKEHTEIRESGDLSIDIKGCTKYQFVPCADAAGFPMAYVPKARFVPRFAGIEWVEPRRLWRAR